MGWNYVLDFLTRFSGAGTSKGPYSLAGEPMGLKSGGEGEGLPTGYGVRSSQPCSHPLLGEVLPWGKLVKHQHLREWKGRVKVRF